MGRLVKRSERCSVVSDSLQPHGLQRPRNSPGQNTGVGNLSLLQGMKKVVTAVISGLRAHSIDYEETLENLVR